MIQPFDYQIDAIKKLFSNNSSGSLLAAHAPGSGKTVTTCFAAKALFSVQSKKLKIVIATTVNTICQWKSTLEEMLEKDVCISVLRTLQDVMQCTKIRGIFIVSHGLLSLCESYLLDGNEPCDLFSFRQSFDLFVVDEIHFARNPATKLCRVLHRLAVCSKYRLGLTGTPIVNKANDLAGISYAINCEAIFSNPKAWGRLKPKFANVDRFDKHMHRVDESFVCVPKYVTNVVNYDLLFSKVHSVQYNEMVSTLTSQARRLRSKVHTQEEAHTVLKNIIKIQQFVVSPRLSEIGASNFDYSSYELKEILSKEPMASHNALCKEVEKSFKRDASLLIFFAYQKILHVMSHVLSMAFDGIQFFEYHGKLNSKDRNKNLANFMASEERRILLLTVKSGGCGLDIGNKCSNIILFHSTGYDFASREQAIRRVVRIGKKNEVVVTDIYAKHTIEEGMHQLHSVKQNIASVILDDDKKSLCDRTLRQTS